MTQSEAKRERQRNYMREVWYPANKAKQVASNARNKAKKREFASALKLERGCMDCGYNKFAPALDFDHLDNKTFLVSQAIGSGIGWKKLIAEIAKCEVVCSNCHRERTEARRGASSSGAARDS